MEYKVPPPLPSAIICAAVAAATLPLLAVIGDVDAVDDDETDEAGVDAADDDELPVLQAIPPLLACVVVLMCVEPK